MRIQEPMVQFPQPVIYGPPRPDILIITLTGTQAIISVGSSVPLISRWLWPGNRTFLKVDSTVHTATTEPLTTAMPTWPCTMVHKTSDPYYNWSFTLFTQHINNTMQNTLTQQLTHWHRNVTLYHFFNTCPYLIYNVTTKYKIYWAKLFVCILQYNALFFSCSIQNVV